MATRQTVGVGMLVICLLGGSPGWGQESQQQPRASELLIQGLELLESGEVGRAKAALQQIDVVQLNRAERSDLQEALRRIARIERQAPPAPQVPEPESAPPAREPTPAPAAEPPAQPVAPRSAPAPPAPPVAVAAPVAAPNGSLIRQAAVLRAQELVAEADRAAEQGQYNRALRLYEEALSINEGNEAAQRGRESVLALLGREGQPRLLDQSSAVFKLRNEQAKASYEEAMRLAVDARTTGNYTLAEDYATRARAILDSNRQWLTEVEYDNRVRTVGEFLAGIREAAEAQAERRQRVELLRRQVEQAKERAEAEQAAEARIQELIRRAADLRKELRYEEALDVLDQALFLEPNNIIVQAMKEMIEDSIIYRNTRDLYRRQSLLIAQQSVENLEATLPHTELILYPPDWPQISALRRGFTDEAAGQSEAKILALGRLQQPLPDVNYDQLPFRDVFAALREAAGVNIVVNERAMEDAGLDMEQPISLSVTNVPASEVLRMVLNQAGGDLTPLDYAVNDLGIVEVSTVESLGRNTLVRTYDINDLIHEVPNFTDAPEFDLQQITQQSGQQGFGGGQGGGGGGGGGGGQGLFSDEGGEDGDEDDRSRSERALDIVNLIQETIDPESWRANGGVVGSISELGGQLIIRTTDKNHGEVVDLLDQLREQRAIMINVEGRFLLVDQNYLDEVGVDLDFTITDPGGNFGPIEVDQGSIDIATRPATGLPGSFLGGDDTTRALSITGSYLNDIQVNFLIRATQANRRSVQLSAPRVTFFNGQQAYVTVATQTAYVANLTAVVGTNAVGLNPTIQTVQSGVILNVQGTVSADRKYVTLTLEPQLAAVGQIRQIRQVLAVAGGVGNAIDLGDDEDDDDAGLAQGIIEAPTLDLTTVATTVSVPDRGTLMLGGQRLYAEVEIEAGIPVLSKIPIINRLTTNRTMIKDERTLLILVKPTILIQAEKEEELFPGSTLSPGTFPTTPAP